MKNENEQLLRKLPSVDSILNNPALEDYKKIPRKLILFSIRQAINKVRELLIKETSTTIDETSIHHQIIADTKHHIEEITRPNYRRAVNATGIILHTGLGRAVLAKQALNQINEELSAYSILQLDIETGNRSKRDQCIEKLLQLLTGAEAAAIVNNNAAATAIVLNTIAKNKEVIVSRGQLVEIGGSFRLPDVMAFSGAKLIEVGTTNKTHRYDYEKAINENTAAILRIHPSNYKIQGFTSEVPLEELVEIAHSNNLVMIDDVGSGALIDFTIFGFEPEPTIPDSISKGADIVTSSGDKLIGASQAGIIVGKAKLIEAIRKNQFARIIRPGKLTLAVLEATLKLFLDETIALSEIPTFQMLQRKLPEITSQAKRMAVQIRKNVSDVTIITIPGFSQMGSGSLPTQNLATTLLAISSEKITSASLAKKLRFWKTPVFTRVQNDKVLIDPRTLRNGDDKIIIESLCEIFGRKN